MVAVGPDHGDGEEAEEKGCAKAAGIIEGLEEDVRISEGDGEGWQVDEESDTEAG